MKDEVMANKLAEEYVKHWIVGEDDNALMQEAYKDGFLEGLKAGRQQWHKVADGDLPKDKHNVWCKCLDQCGEGWYDKDTDTWTLIYRGYHVHCIEAWCELPTFDKE